MPQGILGRKIGMTQVYDGDGVLVPVTVIEAGPCVVVQRKTKSSDGYEAVKLGFGDRSESRTSKANAGCFKKAGVAVKAHVREFTTDESDPLKKGDSVTVSMFEKGSYVDVTGTSKGHGFQGVVTRYRMAGGRMSHGFGPKRRVGSIGQCSFPARVRKGQKMPGHMGSRRVTQQNLKVLDVMEEDNVILVAGAVPGSAGSVLCVKKSIKKPGKADKK